MSKEILHTDKNLGVCPFCQQPVKLYRDRLWTNNGHGYYGNYDYEVGCLNIDCDVQPHTKSISDIYRTPNEAINISIKRWTNRKRKKMVTAEDVLNGIMKEGNV